MEKKCKYDRPYAGKCGAPIKENEVCEKHLSHKCWCGEQGVKGCCAGGSFVCGFPVCEKHECRYVAAGWTGSDGMKHSEKGFQQYQEWLSNKS